jgi:sterol desaturase/sphingolipid hydroxylase (fatty acid hydroxylase superfamily)
LTIICAAVFFIIAERIWPYKKGQKVLREGFFDDLALYTIAQSYILGILIFTFIINFSDNSTGLSKLELFRNVPIWIQLLFFLVTHDLYICWMHQWHHSTGKGRNRNFATKLAIWDWIFGTASYPKQNQMNMVLRLSSRNITLCRHYLRSALLKNPAIISKQKFRKNFSS